MSESVEIGSAYLSLVASAKGIKQQIISEISGDMAAAGQQSGNTLANSTQDTAGSKFSKMGAVLGGLLVAGVGLAAAGIGSAIASAMEAEDAQAKMVAQLGLEPDAVARFGKMSGEIFAGAYGESLGQVNDALVKVTQDIGNGSNEWTETITKNVLSLAQAFEEDLGGVTRAVGQMMRTGLAKDANEALDIITVGMQNGANKSEDLLDTLNEYSTMFRDIGLDGRKALGLISQGLQAGARDADTVADTLKEFAIRAQDGTKLSIDAFEALGLSGKEMTAVFAKGGPEAAVGLDMVLDSLRAMEDPVLRNQTAVALFGAKAEDLGDALYSLDPSSAVEALGKVDGAAQRVNDTLSDTASSKIESWKRTIQQNVVEYIGNTVIPFFQSLADKMNLSGFVRDLKVKVAEVRAFIQVIMSDVRKWIADHQNELGALEITLGDTLDKMKMHISDFTTAVKFIWDNFGENIFVFLIQKLQGLLEFVSGFFTGLKGEFQIIKGTLTGDWSLIWEGIQNVTKGALEILEGLIDSTFGAIVSLLGGDWQAMKDQAYQGWENIKSFVGQGVDNVLKVIHGIAAIPDKVRRWWYEMLVNIAVVHGEILAFVRGIPEGIIRALGNLPSLLWDAGRSIVGGLLDGLKSKTGDLYSFVSTIGPMIAALKGPLSYDKVLLKPAGQAIIGGLMTGMQSMESELYGYVSEIGNKMAMATGFNNPSLSTSIDGNSLAGATSPVIINVYGSDGQSIESLATAVANKQRTLGRL